MMRISVWVGVFCILQQQQTPKKVFIEWKTGKPEGRISVAHGKLEEIKIAQGKGILQENDEFACTQGEPFDLELGVSRSGRTRVTVTTKTQPFTFFLEDVQKDFPIYLPDYGVTVSVDGRPAQPKGQTNLQKIESEPEESFESAMKAAKRMRCQTWLGVSRDMRLFGIGEGLDWIAPRTPSRELARFGLYLGRGSAAAENIQRRLEDGVLPILHGSVTDEDVTYQLTAFATLETRPLAELRGTHYLVADGHSGAFVFTPEQKTQFDKLMADKPDEETVLLARIQAVNKGSVPRHALFKIPAASAKLSFEQGVWTRSGKIVLVTRLNGKPWGEEETAELLQPGESATLEFAIPHRPIPPERGARLAGFKFDERHDECRAFWQKKLQAAAGIRLPETRTTEMIQAGLLHLDLILYGLEPQGTLAPTIGVYAPIGSESAPIIQFLDSMGQHETARRCIQYFLDKQHDDGFMQNFQGYMLETGAALWTMGEHYRYTRDDAWVKQIEPKVLRSCEFIRRWRERNLKEDLRGKGYGMIDGKVADPEDPYHVFMLNGYAYLGLSRVAEMLAGVDPDESAKWKQEAEAFKKDIRAEFFAAMGRSPVIPLGDGTWCPTAPPWPEHPGPVCLYPEGGRWYSHGTFMIRDSALGPLYLVYQEVIDPSEPAAAYLLNMHQELMTRLNVAFSQPYYSRHPWVHLRRGETKAFLKTYYHAAASLADRETYTFWEHYHGVSPHKTHEEAWFLMESRWMVYLERGETMEFLAGVPQAYFKPGATIDVERAGSSFGPFSLHVRSSGERIEVSIEFLTDRHPASIELRLPKGDPSEGSYVSGRLRLDKFSGRARITVALK